MSESFVNPQARRTIVFLQLFFAIVGLLALILGAGRVGVEIWLGDAAADFIEESVPQLVGLFSTATVFIGAGLALAGYSCLYAWTAVGAKEPPALGATRNALLLLVIVLWAAVIWAATSATQFLGVLGLVAGIITVLAGWLWWRVQETNLWQVFGERISRQRENRFILYTTLSLGVVIMVALGVIYAILTDVIELPVRTPESGELLYVSTFDNFNDEWNLPLQERQKGDIVENALVLQEFTGVPESGFYSLLEDRKFGDFDLRVKAQFVSGDPANTLGVVFRQRDTQNYYSFEIAGDGWYRLVKVEDGIGENITPWMPAEDIIHPGYEPNEIRVVAQGDEFQFYINQQPVPLCTKKAGEQRPIYSLSEGCITNPLQDTYQDDTFHQGAIGMAVGTVRGTDISEPVVVRFDNVLLVGPE